MAGLLRRGLVSDSPVSSGRPGSREASPLRRPNQRPLMHQSSCPATAGLRPGPLAAGRSYERRCAGDFDHDRRPILERQPQPSAARRWAHSRTTSTRVASALVAMRVNPLTATRNPVIAPGGASRAAFSDPAATTATTARTQKIRRARHRRSREPMAPVTSPGVSWESWPPSGSSAL